MVAVADVVVMSLSSVMATDVVTTVVVSVRVVEVGEVSVAVLDARYLSCEPSSEAIIHQYRVNTRLIDTL